MSIFEPAKRFDFNCGFCGKECTKLLSLKNNINFCNKICSNNYYNKQRQFYRTIVKCTECGTEFEKHNCYMPRSDTGKHFCTYACYNTFRNKKKLEGEDYRIITLRTRENKCEICGWFLESSCLDVHHIDFNRKNNSPENLIILCPNHHTILTRGMGDIIDGKLLMYNEPVKAQTRKLVHKKHIRKESDMMIVYCQKCNKISSATLYTQDIFLNNKIHKNALVGLCDDCSSLVSIPREIVQPNETQLVQV
jgi:hypothetical protein